uniref:Transposase n=1 Tax=Heterorhabditis bacteriophora TaxID=37862 RepID=A0A1I7X1M7_HETBA
MDKETWYLKPYLDEIETEKKARIESSGLIPGFEMKQSH